MSFTGCLSSKQEAVEVICWEMTGLKVYLKGNGLRGRWKFIQNRSGGGGLWGRVRALHLESHEFECPLKTGLCSKFSLACSLLSNYEIKLKLFCLNQPFPNFKYQWTKNWNVEKGLRLNIENNFLHMNDSYPWAMIFFFCQYLCPVFLQLQSHGGKGSVYRRASWTFELLYN